nr:glycosyl hydrolase [uncultured bacterium]
MSGGNNQRGHGVETMTTVTGGTLRRRRGWALVVLGALALLAGCEAPLDLERVEAELARPVHRFDQFKALARNDDVVMAVGDYGVVVTSSDEGRSWQRKVLPGRPALVSVSACPDGGFAALDTRRGVWLAGPDGGGFERREVETREVVTSVSCVPGGSLWLTASFSTLVVSRDGGETWEETTQDEDLQFSVLQFFDADNGVVVGEFGGFMSTADGGATWERGADIPNEFYPLGMYFRDRDTGWVSGLGGIILATTDGGETWSEQQTDASVPLYRVVPVNGHLYAMGDSGTLLVLDGERWVRAPNAPELLSYLIDAVRLDEGRFLVAGGGGMLKDVPYGR